jgi:hypothetical protein
MNERTKKEEDSAWDVRADLDTVYVINLSPGLSGERFTSPRCSLRRSIHWVKSGMSLGSKRAPLARPSRLEYRVFLCSRERERGQWSLAVAGVLLCCV